jgi:hypothetical protein
MARDSRTSSHTEHWKENWHNSNVATAVRSKAATIEIKPD